MILNETRLETCCSFTGHRPNKLQGGYNLMSKPNLYLSHLIEKTILELISDGVRVFISGGALGFDQIAFLTVNRVKENNPEVGIKNVLALPFFNQNIKWIVKDRDTYNYILELSDDYIYVDTVDGYTVFNHEVGIYQPEKMQLRNQFMVDHSKYLIAYWDGSPGGTKNCIKYAYKMDRSIINIYKKNEIYPLV